jgi:GT2 family glycosyltransferase
MMEATVIVTTMGGPWLGQQLAALADQTQPPVQLVVVNNGPAGGVDDVVAAYRPRLPGLELVEDHSMTVCAHARNVGAARARHPGILFLDDDDVVDSRYVAAMSEALDRAEIVAARMDMVRLNPVGMARGWGAMQADGPMTYHDFLPWVIGGACGVRRDTFTEVGGFDTSLLVGEDTDFCWRAQLEAGAKVEFVPDATVFYRLRSTPRAAFRQSRLWAAWEAELVKRYLTRGLRHPGHQLRALLRWARPLIRLLRARRYEDLVVAARDLGGCVGRLEGSIRYRILYL